MEKETLIRLTAAAGHYLTDAEHSIIARTVHCLAGREELFEEITDAEAAPLLASREASRKALRGFREEVADDTH